MTKDMTGLRFERLTVLERAGSDKNGNAIWKCACVCGNFTLSRGFTLRNGEAKSCGCLTGEQLARRSATHGKHGGPEYMAWAHMLQRCTNPKNTRYPSYGARGIKVCDAWKDFAVFIRDVGERPSQKHSLDRIDNDGNYEPGNVRWATKREQNNNKRIQRWVVYRSKRMTLTEACDMTGINPSTAVGRLKRGWTLEQAVETLPQKTSRVYPKPKRKRAD